MSVITDLDDLARKKGFKDGQTMTRRLALRLGHTIAPGTHSRIAARLDWGRWLCDCPFCGGAELVSRTERTFYCLNCGMAENGQQAMVAVFPDALAEIEAALAGKPAAEQNWRGD